MKINLLGKFKWYIVGFIMVAIMLSVSLSFSTWDSLSLQAKLKNNGSGSYYKMYKVADDINGNKIADVGDIVTFGKYYQNLTDDGGVADKTAIRWIVVHKENNQLTLLAEKVMAFGSFWGNYYHNAKGWLYATQVNGKFYQNYSQSTARAWLNSDYTLRNDGGTPFSSAVGTEPRFKGFLSEAFTEDEQAYITSKTISDIKGYGKDNDPITPTEAYLAVDDKVWLPSWSEVYGTTNTPYTSPGNLLGTTIDGSPSARFSYFNSTAYGSDNAILKGYTTAFASSPFSNYTNVDAKHIANAQSSVADGNVWWLLRSPHPSGYGHVLVVDTDGIYGDITTDVSSSGVRPAICIPL